VTVDQEALVITMIIFNVFPKFIPRTGGVQSSIIHLANAIAEVFPDIQHVLLTRREPGLKSYERIGALHVFRISPCLFSLSTRFIGFAWEKFINQVLFNWTSNIDVIGQLDWKRNENIIVCHDIKSMPLTIRLSKKLHCPWVLYLHGRIGTAPGDVRINCIEQRLLLKTSLIMTNRIQAFNFLKRNFVLPILLLPPYINTSWFRRPSRTFKVHRRLLFVGKLYHRKDPITPIIALYFIKKRIPDIELHIIGEGPLKKSLIELTKKLNLIDNVFFHGETLDVRYHLWQSDIFLATSPYTNYPSQALLEAMSAGLAIVATDVGYTHLLVKHRENGLLVPPKDPLRLANTIIMLYSNPDLLKMLARNAEVFARNFDIYNFSKTYVRILNTVLDKSLECHV